jgi:predicted acylesterase/phospholipase RssA
MVKHLIFAGGGPRCLSLLGALDVLKTHNMINDVKHYWGNSAGALMATFLSLNVPLQRIREVFTVMDFTKFRDIDLGNIVSFGTHWGLDSGQAFTKNIRILLDDLKPGSSEYTLQELPNLHITASDLTDIRPVILDYKSFPTLKVVDALRASTAIPFFYMPFRNPVNNHLLVDGGVACNFPWILLSEEIKKEAIGFNFKISDDTKEPTSLSEYIPRIINFRDKYWRSKSCFAEHPNVINIEIRGIPSWHLALKKEDRDELIKIGHNTALEWFNGRTSVKTKRTPPLTGHPNTPLQDCLSGSKDVSSDSPLCPSQPSHPDSLRRLQKQPSHSSRRWSI